MPSVFTHAIGRPRRRRGPWWLALLIIVAGWAYGQYKPSREPQQDERASKKKSSRRGSSKRSIEGYPKGEDVVVRVTDGDTVTLRRLGSVRLIGVDCPERKQEGGSEATEFTRQALMGKTIEIESCGERPAMSHNRMLGFVYLMDRGRRVLFNRELIREGYARVISLPPCRVDEDAWTADYEAARAARRGLFATLGEVPDAKSYRKANPRR